MSAGDIILTTDKPRAAIDEVFIFVLDDMELRVEEVAENAKRLGEILVARGDAKPDAVLTALSRQQRLGEILVEEGATSEERVASALAEQRHVMAAAQTPQKAAEQQASIRVPAERLDNLMDRVGELVIAQARLREIASSSQDVALKVVSEEIERLASELRDNTMGIRMVPIGSLFGRFRRLVPRPVAGTGQRSAARHQRRGNRARQDHDRAPQRSDGPSHPQQHRSWPGASRGAQPIGQTG